MAAVAKAQAEADDPTSARRNYAAALEAARTIEDLYERRRAVGLLAAKQARSGFAIETLELIEIEPVAAGHLGQIANAFVALRDQASLKRVMTACAENLELVPLIINCNSRAYPEQSAAIANRVFPLL